MVEFGPFAVSYELFIGMRHTLAGRHDRFVSFVSLVSALGIALGVAALLVVLSVMTGFQNELRAKILSVASHLEALSPGDGIADWRSVSADLLRHPDALAAAPNISEQALLVRGETVRGAAVKGILPSEEAKVSDLEKHAALGNPGDLRAGAFNVMLGERLAQRLGVQIGDAVMLVAPRGRLTAAGFLPRIRRFEVAAVFNSGVHEYDANLAYIHLDDARKIYRLPPDSVSSVRLKLRDLLDAPKVRGELSAVRPDLVFYDWTTSHGNLFRALALEKRVMFVILTLIVAVAAFNIVSALVTAVRNKRPDIAILRAMGASSGGIARIFLLQGMFVGCGGLLMGLAAGLPLAANAGAIVGRIEKMFGHALFPGDVYQLGELPSRIVAADVAVVCAAAFFLSLAAAVYPAWRAARLSPAESLRHE